MNSFEWFEKIVGFSERKWNYELNTLPSVIRDNMGSFETYTIDELKNKITNIKKNESKKIKVMFRKKKDKNNEHMFDTSQLQFTSQDGTLFQVASNFNCHELGSPQKSVFSGKYITQLMVDCTQGPSASGGAVFGAFLRVSKHKNKEINLLEDTLTLIPNNGKLYNSTNFEQFNADLIKIGLHKNVQASFCRSDYIFAYNPNASKIDQVFTSTCILNKYDNYFNLADILLEKAYEGTYLSAILRSSPKIVLTLIGGGTFNNPISLIVNKIIKIHDLYSQYLPTDCEVVLPVYEPNRYDIENLFKKNKNVEIVWI
jgi:hypothetical protein